jgi:uncharacterized membrane protein YuzA (DUF378 family)
MRADQSQAPLQYLTPLERLLVGRLVSRIFAVNGRRVAYSLQNYGPKAAARVACCRALTIYGMGFFFLAIIMQVAGVTGAAGVFYVLVGVSAIWGAASMLSALKPRREFQRQRLHE